MLRPNGLLLSSRSAKMPAIPFVIVRREVMTGLRFDITRRGFGLAALGGLVLPGLAAGAAVAKAPPAGTQAPGVYRLKVGGFEVTVLNDGWLPLETKLYSGDQEAAKRMLEAAFLPTEATKTSVNEWLVNTGDRLVLVDTGTSNVFAPTLGRMARNLEAAGVEPAAIDAVILTHMHPDHAGGLLTPEKAVAFPNATVHVSETEYGFWTNEEIYAKVPSDVKPFFDIARAATKPYKDAGKIVTFKDNAELIPGISAVAAPGHTPGHTMIRLTSDGADLLIVADIVHNVALQFAEPDRSIAFDGDQELARKSRKTTFDMAAKDRIAIAGAHLPFPGIGHVARAGSGYDFVPQPWQADL
jgi:glyoxylase-like metal-dependent hydrolase (beta-lactamase superfamily II)